MALAPVYITDIFMEVVAATNAALRTQLDSWLTIQNRNINGVYGSKNHVTQQLTQIGKNPKANQEGISKYPMIAMMMPVKTQRGNSDGYYGLARPPIFYIATVSDNQRLPPEKYRDNFKPVLFPVYEEFLNQLTKHPNIVIGADVNSISHTLGEYPADITSEDNTIFTDTLDILTIEGLEFTIRQLPIQSCARTVTG